MSYRILCEIGSRRFQPGEGPSREGTFSVIANIRVDLSFQQLYCKSVKDRLPVGQGDELQPVAEGGGEDGGGGAHQAVLHWQLLEHERRPRLLTERVHEQDDPGQESSYEIRSEKLTRSVSCLTMYSTIVDSGVQDAARTLLCHDRTSGLEI